MSKRVEAFKAAGIPYVTISKAEYDYFYTARRERDYLLQSDIKDGVKHEIDLGYQKNEIIP